MCQVFTAWKIYRRQKQMYTTTTHAELWLLHFFVYSSFVVFEPNRFGMTIRLFSLLLLLLSVSYILIRVVLRWTRKNISTKNVKRRQNNATQQYLRNNCRNFGVTTENLLLFVTRLVYIDIRVCSRCAAVIYVYICSTLVAQMIYLLTLRFAHLFSFLVSDCCQLNSYELNEFVLISSMTIKSNRTKNANVYCTHASSEGTHSQKSRQLNRL